MGTRRWLARRFRLACCIGLWWLVSPAGGQTASLPEVRPGLWEYTRTVQRSDQNWDARDIVMRECGDPVAIQKKQQETFEKRGCVISTTQVSEVTYRVVAECPAKNGEKFASRSVTTFDGDSAYTSIIDSEGVVAGKPVQFVERVTAERVGECEEK
ncbi:MAG: DUF3617 domain-containing protein [Candidatus Binatia bacterium]